MLLKYDPNRPEDVLKVDADEDGVGGDDAADALRYLVATRGLGGCGAEVERVVINEHGEQWRRPSAHDFGKWARPPPFAPLKWC